MAFGDHLYTRMVRGLKVLLPLIALFLLSTMFLLSRKVDPTAALAQKDDGFRKRVAEQQLSGPRYTGNTGNGNAIVVTAKTARPDPDIEGKAYGQVVKAVIDTDNGGTMTVLADTGIIDEANDLAVLSGNVHILTSDGYDFRTSQLTSLISKIEGESAGKVNGFGPPGTLTAGKMFVTSDETTGSVHLNFKDGVHLIYDPKD